MPLSRRKLLQLLPLPACLGAWWAFDGPRLWHRESCLVRLASSAQCVAFAPVLTWPHTCTRVCEQFVHRDTLLTDGSLAGIDLFRRLYAARSDVVILDFYPADSRLDATAGATDAYAVVFMREGERL